MARKSLIYREKQKQACVRKYAQKRIILKTQIQNANSFEEKLTLHRKLQRFPKNSCAVRLHNRCALTARPKGYFRLFGLSRHMVRKMASNGFLPGVTKSSW